MSLSTSLGYDLVAASATLGIVIDDVPETQYIYQAGVVNGSERLSPAVVPLADFTEAVRGIFEFAALVRKRFAPVPSLNDQARYTQTAPKINYVSDRIDIDGTPTARFRIGKPADRLFFEATITDGIVTVIPRQAFSLPFASFQLWLAHMRNLIWLLDREPQVTW